MKITDKHIPLCIASGLSIIAMYMSSSFFSFLNPRSINIDLPVVMGFLGIGLTWITMLLKRKIWVYFFLFVIGFSFTSMVTLSYFNFSLFILSLELNLITLPLLIAHFVLNFGDPSEPAPPTPEDGWTKVNVFKHYNQNKSNEAIVRMLKGELVPEARQALEEILESRGKN
ncbi:MAG: hypothetical protein COA38_21150 [Fluviicola sp.]|nr:MAG: hypothetical protein COA38_21150 [Fluviicola sp.]